MITEWENYLKNFFRDHNFTEGKEKREEAAFFFEKIRLKVNNEFIRL